MTNEIYDIYDRIFKRIFSLSNLAMINMINGLFGTNYPPDSTVEYPNKEYVSRFLDKRLMDVLIIIQGIAYHLEAQIASDETIVVRAFEYGFYYAVNSREDDTVLRFPEPIIIYLSPKKNIPEKSTLTLDFGEQGSFSYEVKNYLYLSHSIQEINQKKLIALIPFQLLKLKDIIAKDCSEKNWTKLQKLIQRDIIGSIKANLQVGNITKDDADQLLELTHFLYDHIYQHYEELGGHGEMKPLLDGALELPLDKYRIQVDELKQANASLEQEKSSLEQEIARLTELLKKQEK